jgi:hypothetical protein
VTPLKQHCADSVALDPARELGVLIHAHVLHSWRICTPRDAEAARARLMQRELETLNARTEAQVR